MNKFLAFGIGLVLLGAAIALFVAGQIVLGSVFIALGFVFDLLFVKAMRDEFAARKKT